MDKVRCKRCGYMTEKLYLFHCPIHGEFHNDGGIGYCCKFRERCDGLNRACCPECGFMPCDACHGHGVLKDCKGYENEKCYHCNGSGKEPFRLREPARERPTSQDFQERMLVQAKEFALRARIRYLLIKVERGEYISLKDVRFPGYSYGIPLGPKERRNFYGWLQCFAKGKHRRFANKWEDLLKPITK